MTVLEEPEKSSEEAPVGVILIGGRSSRMGFPKATLKIRERSLLECTFEKLETVCADIVLSNGPDARNIPAGDHLHAAMRVPDVDHLEGPAAGILAANQAWPGRRLLVVACDLPGVTASLLAALANRSADWVVPRHHGRLEPLCALYGPAALAALERRAARGDLALHRLADEDLVIDYLEGPDFDDLGDPEELFLNLNSPGDLRRAERLGVVDGLSQADRESRVSSTDHSAGSATPSEHHPPGRRARE